MRELDFFLLEESFSGMSADDLANMMNGVDLNDSNQHAVALDALDAVGT